MMRKNWFTIERLERDTYVISEYKHWEETHCYLLLGQTSAILIDAGLGVADISQPVRAITSLPIQVVVTHVHSDHIGGCGYRRPPAGGALAQWPIPSEPPDGAGKQPFAQTLRLSAGI